MNVPEVTTEKISTPTVQLLMSQTPGLQTESHQISTRCTDITADYSAEIKILIIQFVFKRQSDEWRSLSNCGQIVAKIARFNKENSEIVGRKFTKFGYDVARLLASNMLKADLRSANPLSNAKAKSKGHSPRRRLYNFLCLKLHGHWTESHQISTGCTEMIADCSAEIKTAIFQSVWERQRDEWRSSSNCEQFAAKIAHFNSENSEIVGQSSPHLDTMYPDYCHWTRWKQIYDQPIRCRMPKQRVMVTPPDVCEHLLYITGCHSNIPRTTAKRILEKSSLLIRLTNL